MGTKILLTGTHSTGKSTLLNLLREDDFFKEFKFIGGVTREAREYGLDINEKGDTLTQLYCMSKDFLNLVQNQHENVVYDRSILDTYIYTKYLRSSVDDWFYETVLEVCNMLLSEFDYIFWLRPEWEITNDRVRSMNKKFQEGVDLLFEEYFQLHPQLKYVRLIGESEQKVKQIKQTLNVKL